VTLTNNGNAERTLGMGAIAQYIEAHTGHKPGRSTLWRWHLTGRLAARRIGGRLFTTESAIREMLAADEQRNRGSANARGEAAAVRIEALTARSSRRAKGGRR
jgi:glutathione S-transferase